MNNYKKFNWRVCWQPNVTKKKVIYFLKMVKSRGNFKNKKN